MTEPTAPRSTTLACGFSGGFRDEVVVDEAALEAPRSRSARAVLTIMWSGPLM